LKRTAMLLLAAALATSCGKDPHYSYFAVDVTVAPSVDEDFLKAIESCAIVVYHVLPGSDPDPCGSTPISPRCVRIDYENLPCMKPNVKYMVSRAEYSTTLRTGALHFTVLLQDLYNQVIARGDSADLPLGPKTDVTTNVEAKPTGIFGRPGSTGAPPP
jgi:hypothetical protein